ncbi:MAG: hypothetical protein ACJ74H_07295 [Thermoanaerobaculia bacterium]
MACSFFTMCEATPKKNELSPFWTPVHANVKVMSPRLLRTAD